MITPGLQTSEGKKSLGILVAGATGIYYILSSRNPELPEIGQLLANAESAVDIAKAYTTTVPTENTISNVSGQAFDASTIIAILFGMYKTFSKYTDERTNLKTKDIEKDLKLKQAEAIITSYNYGSDHKSADTVGTVNTDSELKKF